MSRQVEDDRHLADRLSFWEALMMCLWSVGILLRKLSDWLSVLVRRGVEEPIAPSLEHGLELTVVADESLEYENQEISPVVTQPTSTLTMYFLASSVENTSPASGEPASEAERTERSFRQTLFQLVPGLRDFGQTQIEWHALNFCHLDTSGYMASVRENGFPRLSLGERFRAELIHFRILLQEQLERYERSWRSYHTRVPSYVSLRDCPPDPATDPSYYGI